MLLPFCRYSGQVKCHLTLGKAKEAAACAREALTLYPRSCEAHIVMGSVFAAGSAEVSVCDFP